MDYRDVHSSKRKVESYLKLISKTSMSKSQKDNIRKFVDLLRIGKIGQKAKDRRITNYLQFLVKIHKYFRKDIDKITEKEAEKFYKDLQENKIKRNNGMPFSESSKDEFVKALKRYLGWRWGRESKKYSKGLKWMKLAYKKSNKKAITLEQVEKVLRQKETSRNKCLFMFLFDSGARIEECLNVTIGDLTSNQEEKNSYYIVHLRGQKTEESDRTIPIPLSTKYIISWLKKHPTRDKEDYLFPIRYDNARKIIRTMSEKVLGSDLILKPHELRHSSVTHYIQHGGFGAENIGGFYYRYGWKFGSKEAIEYIKQYLFGGKIGHQKVVDNIISDRMGILEKQIEKMRKEKEQTDQEVAKWQEEHAKQWISVCKKFEDTVNILGSLKTLETERQRHMDKIQIQVRDVENGK